ncbi:cysteine proteinase inhibitor B-like [Silene latifolia]|uniref:cysteine proteinase inhibitor B-like n=1 Tax=Silene latifolia TaxID=37657 RepID=UPI003D76E326
MEDPRTDVPNVRTNKEIQDMGKFAVEAYNLGLRQGPPRQEGGGGIPLVFVAVVKAQKQTVAGWMYYLKIEAMQGGVTRNFDAEVFDQSWNRSNPTQLVKFIPCPT